MLKAEILTTEPAEILHLRMMALCVNNLDPASAWQEGLHLRRHFKPANEAYFSLSAKKETKFGENHQYHSMILQTELNSHGGQSVVERICAVSQRCSTHFNGGTVAAK